MNPRRKKLGILLWLLAALVLYFNWQWLNSNPKQNSGAETSSKGGLTGETYEKDTLTEDRDSGQAVEGGDSLEEKPNSKWREDRIIVLSLNDGFFDFFLNWLWFFKKLEINNVRVAVIALDDVVVGRLEALQEEQILITRGGQEEGIQDAQSFDTESYKILVSQRPSLILPFLERGVDVLYTDTDVVWLRDPFPYLDEMTQKGSYDILMPSDGERSGKTFYCSGFMWVKATERSITLMKEWEKVLLSRPQKNQDSLHKLIHQPGFVKHGKLISALFSNTISYNRPDVRKNRDKVYIFHNNYVPSHDKKLANFKKHNLWKVENT